MEHNECTHVATLPRRYVACSSTLTCTGHLGTRPGPLAALAGLPLPAARLSRCCWLVQAPPRLLPRAAACSGAGAAPAAAMAAAPATAAAGDAAVVMVHAVGSRLVQGLQQAGKGGYQNSWRALDRWIGDDCGGRHEPACSTPITCDPRSGRRN